MTLAGLAAVIAIGAIVFFQQPATQPVWGLAKLQQIPATVSSADYLHQIALLAKEWDKKPTETIEALKNRQQQFIEGCNAVLAADHPQLNKDDLQMMREACQECRDALIQNQTALQDRVISLADANTAANKAIDAFVQKLEERASA